MVCIGDKPYIDVRVSLHSLTPSTIPLALRRELCSFGTAKLARHPEFHDKLEFEIAFSCSDLRTDERLRELQASGFARKDVRLLRDRLRIFTNGLLASSENVIMSDMARMKQLRQRQLCQRTSGNGLHEHLAIAYDLLVECRDLAIPIFTRLARFAFVGLAFLKSLHLEGIISDNIYDGFFSSLDTIANDLHTACIKVSEGKCDLQTFLLEYGHLRPMTYDITSPRYDHMPVDVWLRKQEKTRLVVGENAGIEPRVVSRINVALKSHGIDFDARALLCFIKSAVEAREYAKFVFTKHVSDALEYIALCGCAVQLSRAEVAHIPIEDIFFATQNGIRDKQRVAHLWRTAIRRNRTMRELLTSVVLPPHISDENDLYVVKYPKAYPNFVTHHCVQGSCVFLRNVSRLNAASIKNSIVLLESADPGYDWIFAYNPKGIVTKYGGAGSHMTIRCGAFEVPAAIGCGEDLFERLARGHMVLLDSKAGIVTPLV
jgi:hypothetical protein